jgi:hypothetical protein
MGRALCTKQVSVFLENKAGRLAEVCVLLGRAGLNLRAFCTADTAEFGILRIIASDPDRAREVLEAEGFTVREIGVLAVQLADHPGALGELLTAFGAEGINVEYLYAFVTPVDGLAVVILRVLDEVVDRAATIVEGKGLSILPPERVYEL